MYHTGCSQAVPHPSTIPARRCLTSVIWRELVSHRGMVVRLNEANPALLTCFTDWLAGDGDTRAASFSCDSLVFMSKAQIWYSDSKLGGLLPYRVWKFYRIGISSCDPAKLGKRDFLLILRMNIASFWSDSPNLFRYSDSTLGGLLSYRVWRSRHEWVSSYDPAKSGKSRFVLILSMDSASLWFYRIIIDYIFRKYLTGTL